MILPAFARASDFFERDLTLFGICWATCSTSCRWLTATEYHEKRAPRSRGARVYLGRSPDDQAAAERLTFSRFGRRTGASGLAFGCAVLPEARTPSARPTGRFADA